MTFYQQSFNKNSSNYKQKLYYRCFLKQKKSYLTNNILMKIHQISNQNNIFNANFKQKLHLINTILSKIHQITNINNIFDAYYMPK